MNIKFLLTEKISDIVFHKTSLNNAIKIINDNRFRLSATLGTEAEKKINDKTFYFSIARSPLSSYIAQESYVGNVYFTLNGTKLNQNYKGFPVDYWGPEFRKIDAKKNEMEDRIVSDKQYIENAKSYIEEINVLVEYDTEDEDWLTKEKRIKKYKVSDNELKRVQELFSVAKKTNIPIYLYSDVTSFRSRNKNKAIKNPIQWLKEAGSFEIKPNNYQSRKRNYFDEWMELLNFPIEKYDITGYDDYQKRIKGLLSKRSDNLLFNKILYYTNDGISSLKNDIHNSKATDEIGKFITTIRKYKLKDVDGVVEFLKNKWKVIKD